MARRMRFRKARKVLAIVMAPVAVCMLLNLLFPLPVEQLHPASSTAVLDQEGELLRAFLAPDEAWRIRVEGDEIPAVLKQAVLAYEDQRFYRHPGVDPIAVARALRANLEARRIVQGGSTITMQLARMMEPKARTLPNKLIEAFRALQLEWQYDKDDLLTLYFNLAPYGGNLVGVGAASYLYFDKHPRQLSLGEAALLAAIPNDPNKRRPDLNEAEARSARAGVLARMIAAGGITQAAASEAEAEQVPVRRYDLPFLAPHLAVHLAGRFDGAERLPTTIDADLQRLAETRLADHLTPWLSQGITNGAVVIIENETQAVRALVGSREFFDSQHQGQVNGAMAPRSPGSALKPFVYALAFERGLATPHSQRYDIPVDYGGYRPENYDRQYRGIVQTEEALIRSLNVPAVGLSAELGPDAMYQFLKAGGISSLTEPSHHYGLSLILGGSETTLLDLTNLYAMLANGGIYRPYRLLESQQEREGKRLLSEGAAFIVTEILSKLRRPELPAVWEWSRDMPTVAWKTGTSYAHRDAWSIGYTPRYTVGVWIGNMDAKSATALIGAEVAAPLLFSLIGLLEKNPSAPWFIEPKDVEMRRVCALSGGGATPYCASSRQERYLPGKSPAEPCTLHREIWIDDETGHRLCSHCRLGRTHYKEVVTQWPAEIAQWLHRAGYPLDAIPTHLPACTRLAVGEPPVIRTPQPGAEYRLRSGVPAEFQQIKLEASVSNGTDRIYWFVDGEMIYDGPPNEQVFMNPEPGRHSLLCVDDEGRSSEVEITVR